MAESLRCSPETVITLLISYTSVQNKKLKKKNLKTWHGKKRNSQVCVWIVNQFITRACSLPACNRCALSRLALIVSVSCHVSLIRLRSWRAVVQLLSRA